MSASNDVSEHLIETSTAAAAVTVSGATETTEAVSDFTAKELAPENSSTQHNNQVQPSCSKNFAADNQSEAMTVPVVEGSLAVENQPSLPVGVGVGTSVGGATTSGNSSTAMGSPVTSGLPFLSAVDSLTSVSPILQSLFSRIEAEFQTLVQENARLHSENAKLSQRMEQLQQYISSNTSMNNNNPNFCMSSTGSTINNNNMDDSGLLDPSPSSQANMPRAPAVMGSGPNSETCTPVSSVILSNNNTNLLPMSAVGGAGGGTAIASMPNQSVAASSTTDQKTRLRMAQRTKTGLTKIVSTFKAGTLDAVNSGAIGAISSRTGGGSNSTVSENAFRWS
ncbi:uncharacterized protein LOC142358284 [Convolutriloba macropyga]|uniref:uncharacterized protein LOC142358284 n=1 Tax=Convolutriloba macropyga TaxID=536237 RepID=UPI003F52682D